MLTTADLGVGLGKGMYAGGVRAWEPVNLNDASGDSYNGEGCLVMVVVVVVREIDREGRKRETESAPDRCFTTIGKTFRLW